MTFFKKQNYYERMEVSPSASPFEICHAYRQALQIYNDDALASYSFFTEAERREILDLLKEAFSTLVNEEFRNEYDRSLIKNGALKESHRYKRIMKDPMSIFKQMDAKSGTLLTQDRPNPENNPNIKSILAKDNLTGKDLRQLRLEMGLTLEQIAARIKVRTGLLQYIEEDQFDRLPARVYLKSFLTQYVQCLCIDTELVVQRYLQRIDD